MKIEFKITPRDKKLLIFLSVFLILVAFYMWVVRPGMDTITMLQGEIVESGGQVFEMQMKLDALPTLEAEFQVVKEEWEKASAYLYDPLSSQEIDKLVTAQVLDCGLNTKNLNITINKSPAVLSAYGEDSSASGTGRQGIYSATVHLRAEGSREQVRSLVNIFTNDYPAVHVVNYSYEENQMTTEEEVLETNVLNLTIDIYMCVK